MAGFALAIPPDPRHRLSVHRRIPAQELGTQGYRFRFCALRGRLEHINLRGAPLIAVVKGGVVCDTAGFNIIALHYPGRGEGGQPSKVIQGL